MPADRLFAFAREALFLGAALSLPIVVVAAVVGVVVAALQAATQIQDPTIAHLPRLLATAAAIALFGPGIAHAIGAFAERIFAAAAVP